MSRVRNDWVFSAAGGSARHRREPALTWIWDGDSNVTGQGIPERQSTLLTVPFGCTEVMAATAGHKLTDVLSGISSIAIPAGRVIYFLNAGTNDIGVEGITDPAIILARTLAVFAAVRARFPNCIIVIYTIPPATSITGAGETCRVAANAARMAGLTGADIRIDWAAQAPNAGDALIYPDGVHRGIYGHELAAYQTHDALRDCGLPGVPQPVPGISTIRDLPGCLLELHANAGVTESSGVTAWADQSGNGHHFVVGGNGKPALNADDGDGYPSIQFDGVNDGLLHVYSSNPTVTHINSGQAYTLIDYWRAPSAGDGSILQLSGNVFAGRAGLRVNAGSIALGVEDDAAHSGELGTKTFTADAWHMAHVTHDGAGAFLLGHNTTVPTGGTVASFGASTTARSAIGYWETQGGPWKWRDSRQRSVAKFQRVLPAVELWQARYLLRWNKWRLIP